MKSAFIFLLLVQSLVAQVPSPESLKRAEPLIQKTIPHLTLKEATFEEGLSAIERAWREQNSDEPLPVAITDFAPPEGYRKETPVRITLDLRDVPFIEALLLFGQTSFRTFSAERALPQFERHHWIEEGWSVRVFDIPPATLAALGLRADSSSADIQRVLRQFGVELEDWMKPHLIGSGQQLALMSYAIQQEQLAGILAILRNGYKITK